MQLFVDWLSLWFRRERWARFVVCALETRRRIKTFISPSLMCGGRLSVCKDSCIPKTPDSYLCFKNVPKRKHRCSPAGIF